MPEMKAVTGTSWKLASVCAKAAVSGGVDQSEQDDISAFVEETLSAKARLAEAFAKARRHDMEAKGGEVLTGATLHQHAVVYAVSGYAASCTNMADRLLDEDEREAGIGPFSALLTAIKELPSPMFSNVALPDATRQFLTYVIVFIFGRYGLPHVIPDWNSTPPGTVAYLLSQTGHAGSALKKNFDRFVGVTFGTMVGQLIYVVGCNLGDAHGVIWPQAIQTFAFFVFQLCGFYVYFGTTTYSYVGLLIACFGAEHMLLGCGIYGPDDSDSDSAVYMNLMGQLVAIMSSAMMDNAASRGILFFIAVVTVRRGMAFDSNLGYPFLGLAAGIMFEKFIGNTPAWKLATSALENFKETFHTSFEEAVQDAPAEDTCLASGAALVQTMASEGQEADMEPRLDKTHWRIDLWHKITENCHRLWTSLAALHHCQKHTDCFNTVGSMPEMTDEVENLIARADATLELAVTVMKHNSVTPIDMNDSLSTDRPSGLSPQVLSEVNRRFRQKYGAVPPHSQDLLNDEAAATSCVVVLLDAILGHLSTLEDTLAQVPEVYHSLVGDADRTHGKNRAVFQKVCHWF
jgi:hypothetical protein